MQINSTQTRQGMRPFSPRIPLPRAPRAPAASSDTAARELPSPPAGTCASRPPADFRRRVWLQSGPSTAHSQAQSTPSAGRQGCPTQPAPACRMAVSNTRGGARVQEQRRDVSPSSRLARQGASIVHHTARLPAGSRSPGAGSSFHDGCAAQARGAPLRTHSAATTLRPPRPPRGADEAAEPLSPHPRPLRASALQGVSLMQHSCSRVPPPAAQRTVCPSACRAHLLLPYSSP